jgi:uncharacterized peroxidase-related enzyme
MAHHGACLRLELERTGALGGNAAQALEDVWAGRPSAVLSAAERAMVAYTVKLTKTPGEMSQADVDELRAHGFTDRAIYDIASIAGFFAYVTRLAQGLGVPLRAHWEEIARTEWEKSLKLPLSPRP